MWSRSGFCRTDGSCVTCTALLKRWYRVKAEGIFLRWGCVEKYEHHSNDSMYVTHVTVRCERKAAVVTSSSEWKQHWLFMSSSRPLLVLLLCQSLRLWLVVSPLCPDLLPPLAFLSLTAPLGSVIGISCCLSSRRCLDKLFEERFRDMMADSESEQIFVRTSSCLSGCHSACRLLCSFRSSSLKAELGVSRNRFPTEGTCHTQQDLWNKAEEWKELHAGYTDTLQV